MHGVGKGRKPGARNKTVAERIIDLVVMSSGGNHNDTLNILQDHWDASASRKNRGQNPVRTEFADGNKFSDRYLNAIGMGSSDVKDTMSRLLKLANNPQTVSRLDD